MNQVRQAHLSTRVQQQRDHLLEAVRRVLQSLSHLQEERLQRALPDERAAVEEVRVDRRPPGAQHVRQLRVRGDAEEHLGQLLVNPCPGTTLLLVSPAARSESIRGADCRNSTMACVQQTTSRSTSLRNVWTSQTRTTTTSRKKVTIECGILSTARENTRRAQRIS